MAQPYFTNQPVPIQQVSPELLMAPGRAMGRAFEKLGQSIAGAMERKEQKRQKQERQDAAAKILQDVYGATPEEAAEYAKVPEVFKEAMGYKREQKKFELEKDKAKSYIQYQESLAKEQERKTLAEQMATENKKIASDAYKAFKEGKDKTVVEDIIKRSIEKHDRTILPQWKPTIESSIDPFIPQEQTGELTIQSGKITEGHSGANTLVLERELAAARGDKDKVTDISNRLENMRLSGMTPTSVTEGRAEYGMTPDQLMTQALLAGADDVSDPIETQLQKQQWEDKSIMKREKRETKIPLKGEDLIRAVSDEFGLTGEQYKAFRDMVGATPEKMEEQIKLQQAMATLQKTNTEVLAKNQDYIAETNARDFSSVMEPVKGPRGKRTDIFGGSMEKAQEFRMTQAQAESGIELFDQAIDINKRFENLKNQGYKDWASMENIAEAKKLMEVSKSIATQIIGTNRLDLLGPGALTEADIKLLNEAIGDPTKMFDLVGGNSAKLRALRQKIIKKMETQEASMGWKRKEGMEIGTNFGQRELGMADMSWYDDPKNKLGITEEKEDGTIETTFSGGGKARPIITGQGGGIM
jgi:AraC-like DNA-binding protein